MLITISGSLRPTKVPRRQEDQKDSQSKPHSIIGCKMLRRSEDGQLLTLKKLKEFNKNASVQDLLQLYTLPT